MENECKVAVYKRVATSLCAALVSTSALAATQAPDQDGGYAIVVLNGAPLSVAPSTKPISSKKIDFSSAAVASHRAALAASRTAYRRWLRTNYPDVKVTGEFDIALNAVALQLNGASLAQVGAMRDVRHVSYQSLFYKQSSRLGGDSEQAISRASQAWAQNSLLNSGGAGIKVAVIDSGIDITHPCFHDKGYPVRPRIGDSRFVNNKVIAARAFNASDLSNRATPAPTDAHGTHISGTIACNQDTEVKLESSSASGAMSGVAPKALLGNYNIFPGAAVKARSEDVLHAMEAAYQDGFDIVNFSLASGQRSGSGIEIKALRNLDQANMIFAVAPGTQRRSQEPSDVVSAAQLASQANDSDEVPAMSVIESSGAKFFGLRSVFGVVPVSGLAGPLSPVIDARADVASTGGLSQACGPMRRFSLTGSIAMILRGGCDFTTKLRNVEAAGAVAAIVVAQEGEELIVMAPNDDAVQPNIPAFMLAESERELLQANRGIATMLPGITPDTSTATIDKTSRQARAKMFAGFTALPDAPGVVEVAIKTPVQSISVLSAVPATACSAPPCFAFMSDPSMISATLAGKAATLRSRHPAWSAAEVRAALLSDEANARIELAGN